MGEAAAKLVSIERASNFMLTDVGSETADREGLAGAEVSTDVTLRMTR